MVFRAFKFIAVSALLALVKKAWAKQSAKPARSAKPAARSQKQPRAAKGVHTLRPRRKSAATNSHASH
jgi:hypothetical protein